MKVWNWCIERKSTIHAEHLPGVVNVQADWELQYRTDSSDLKFTSFVFLQLENKLDMFASTTNAHFCCIAAGNPTQQL